MTAVARVRWWESGGLHVHVTHPDGTWERRVFRRDQWYEVDAIVNYIQRMYGRENVEVDG